MHVSQTQANSLAPSALFITASASIANRVSSDDRGQYLDAALEGWKWFDDAGVINDNNLVTDGVDGDCKPNGAIYTYNQGSIIGGLVELATATGDDSYLDTAADIADAVIADGSPLVDDGILVDGCDRSHNCDGNGVAFKGVFARNLRRLQAVRPQDRYRDFLTKNAQSIWNNDLGIDDGGACNNGPYWAGPYSDDDKSTVAQAVALDALTAAWAVTK